MHGDEVSRNAPDARPVEAAALDATDGAQAASGRALALWGGVLLGIGLGGFFDGIVFHQLLQWHHLLSSVAAYPVTTVADLRVNTFWDGVFMPAPLWRRRPVWSCCGGPWLGRRRGGQAGG